MLSYYLKLIGQFYQDMRRQKLRTFLTLFGITWGTIAVVLLLAFGVGLQANSLRAMHGLGTNIVIMGGRRTTKPYQGMKTGRSIPTRVEDAELLRKRIPEMELMSPEADDYVKACYKRETRRVTVSGVYPEFQFLRNMIADCGGRFVNDQDMSYKRRVVFLGDELRDDLFGKGSNPVGKLVTLNGTPFIVVGVLQKKVQTNMYGGPDANHVYMPFTTFRATYGGLDVDRLIFRAKDPALTDKVKKAIYQELGRKYRFDPEDESALWMWDTAQGEKFMSYFFIGFQAFMALGGILTLLVGGIGVANIMYIVVRERRREIGIKMALGATSRTILLQFMVETLVIVSLGGLLGFAFSYGVTQLFHLPLLAQATKFVGYPRISGFVALSTIGVIGLIGFTAGFAPARRAASMDPIQALEF